MIFLILSVSSKRNFFYPWWCSLVMRFTGTEPITKVLMFGLCFDLGSSIRFLPTVK
jgi:hypothetical protein